MGSHHHHGQSFAVPAAWPVALEAQVEDDAKSAQCGRRHGIVFEWRSSAPSCLSKTGRGKPWQSGNTMGPVMVTITATDSTQTLTRHRSSDRRTRDFILAEVLSAAVSAASIAPTGPLPSGLLNSLFGGNLGKGNAQAPALALGTTLSDASVGMASNALPLSRRSRSRLAAAQCQKRDS